MLQLTVAPGNQFTEGYGNEFTIIVTNLDHWPGAKYVLGNKISLYLQFSLELLTWVLISGVRDQTPAQRFHYFDHNSTILYS